MQKKLPKMQKMPIVQKISTCNVEFTPTNKVVENQPLMKTQIRYCSWTSTDNVGRILNEF